jgi:hypothetical protein
MIGGQRSSPNDIEVLLECLIVSKGRARATLSKFRILHAGFGDVDRRDRNLGRWTQWERRQGPISVKDAPNTLQARNSPGGSVGRQKGKAKHPIRTLITLIHREDCAVHCWCCHFVEVYTRAGCTAVYRSGHWWEERRVKHWDREGGFMPLTTWQTASSPQEELRLPT